MASNDPEPKNDPAFPPQEGPVAFLTRLVHVPALNDQTPLRILCVLVLAVVMSFLPIPVNIIGYVALAILALSLGRITPIK